MQREMRVDSPKQRQIKSPAEFRPATLADLHIIAGWILTRRDCELWAGPRIPYPLDVDLLPADIDLFGADSTAMVAGNRLLAFGQVIDVSGSRAHLARIIVAPFLRGRGHGKSLVSELMARARRRGCHCITLYVDHHNQAALSMYAGLGFKQAQHPPDEQASPESLFMSCLCTTTSVHTR